MATRTICMYEGEQINIESIYTVADDGSQIYIEDKLKDVRKWGRQGKLLCPCGCGSKLILVAGDKMIKAQHFRIKEKGRESNCRAVYDDENIFLARIVLKCWFDDKLKSVMIRCRQPLYRIGDTDRRYELTLFDGDSKIGLNYWKNRFDIDDYKLKSIDDTNLINKVIYVLGELNENTNGQYQEHLMKIQDRQGYVLMLSKQDKGYSNAIMEVKYYIKNEKGKWDGLFISKGNLADYDIREDGILVYKNNDLFDLIKIKKENYLCEIERRKSEYEKKMTHKEKKDSAIKYSFSSKIKKEDAYNEGYYKQEVLPFIEHNEWQTRDSLGE